MFNIHKLKFLTNFRIKIKNKKKNRKQLINIIKKFIFKNKNNKKLLLKRKINKKQKRKKLQKIISNLMIYQNQDGIS